MNSSGKSKLNWTPQILMDLLRCKREAQVQMKWKKTDKRAAEQWNEMCYEHLQRQNMSDRAAKAERGSKTLRDHMKEQIYCLKLQKTAILFKKVNLGERVQMNPLLLRAKQTLQIKSPTPQESKTERCQEEQGYQRRILTTEEYNG